MVQPKISHHQDKTMGWDGMVAFGREGTREERTLGQ